MTNSDVSVSGIFNAAVRLPVEERTAYLNNACRDRERLRSEVESLLAAHDREESFMEGPAATITFGSELAEGPGTTIGSYKLLQQIGEGGMGVVFMAEQEHPVRRRVALKIIKPGMDSRQVVARFEAERQALAMMDHQNIARVLDAGTTDTGRPFFVMELVHGVPLTKFCDDNRLTLRQRLDLFVPVCQAIQHAHQKGIIHRDIKPGNILVTMYDDKPVPKVIDFGVAKAVEQRLTERTLFTQYGTLVGTFEYMSPEQAEMNAFGVDTRSDVYSLGVLLYELLTGTTPIERSTLRNAALVELVRMIREDEPPRPSVRVSTSNGLPKFAASCRSEPAQLPRLIRGELDWIVMKCLEKDRTRRYETVNGLTRDIQRFLSDEPVEACPPSPLYRLRKLARRNRGLLTTVVAFALLLVLATTVSVSLAAWAIKAHRQAEESLESERMARQEAVEAKEQADQAAKRLRTATRLTSEGIEYYRRSNWSAAYERLTKAIDLVPDLDTPYLHRATLFVKLGLWDRAADDYAARFRLAPEADAHACFEHALLRLYVGDGSGYRKACDELVRQHGHSAEIADQFTVLRSRLLTAKAVNEPEELVRQAEELANSARAPWLLGLASRAHMKAGDLERAESRCREAIQLGTGSPSGVHRVNYIQLANVLFQQGKQTEAEEALSIAEKARDQWLTRKLNNYMVKIPEVEWFFWVEFNIYFREAQSLITGSDPPEDPRFDELYQQGLAAITYGDVFTHMDAGREQVKRRAWESAAENFVKVLDKLPIGFRPSSQEMRFCVEMVDVPEVFSWLDQLRPEDRRLWYARGRLLAGRRQWSEAVACYHRSFQLTTEDHQAGQLDKALFEVIRSATRFELAALHLLAGDAASFRELCAEIAAEPVSPGDAFSACCLSRTYTLAPDGLGDWSLPLDLARQVVHKQPRIAWNQYSLGLAFYRAGELERATKAIETSFRLRPDWLGRSQNDLVLALIHCQSNQLQQARQRLGHAKSARNELERTMAFSKFGYATSEYLCDWLSTLVLLTEVEKQLDGQNSME